MTTRPQFLQTWLILEHKYLLPTYGISGYALALGEGGVRKISKLLEKVPNILVQTYNFVDLLTFLEIYQILANFRGGKGFHKYYQIITQGFRERRFPFRRDTSV